MFFGEAEQVRRMGGEVRHAREIGLGKIENTGVLQAFGQISQNYSSPKYKTGEDLTPPVLPEELFLTDYERPVTLLRSNPRASNPAPISPMLAGSGTLAGTLS